MKIRKLFLVMLLLVIGSFAVSAETIVFSEYKYTQTFNITNVSDNGLLGKNGQINLTVNTTNLINNFNLSSNCGDLRFYDVNTNLTFKSYNITACNSLTATFWVNFTFTSTPFKIGMAWANSTKTQARNITSVFPEGSDFNFGDGSFIGGNFQKDLFTDNNFNGLSVLNGKLNVNMSNGSASSGNLFFIFNKSVNSSIAKKVLINYDLGYTNYDLYDCTDFVGTTFTLRTNASKSFNANNSVDISGSLFSVNNANYFCSPPDMDYWFNVQTIQTGVTGTRTLNVKDMMDLNNRSNNTGRLLIDDTNNYIITPSDLDVFDFRNGFDELLINFALVLTTTPQTSMSFNLDNFFIALYPTNTSISANGITALSTPDVNAPSVKTLSATPNPANQGQTVTLKANVTDDVSVGTVIFQTNISGTLSNQTATLVSGLYQVTTSTSTIGNHSFKVFANDTSGNANSTSASTFSVVDSTSPSVIALSASPDPQTRNQPVVLSANVSDPSNVSSVIIQTDIDGVLVNHTTTVSGATYSTTVTTNTVGVHTFTVYSNDSLGNVNSTESSTFEVTSSYQGNFLTGDATAAGIDILVGALVIPVYFVGFITIVFILVWIVRRFGKK